MYDLSSKFNTFYTSYVVLSQDEQNNLHNKKDLNVQRLKDGLYKILYLIFDYPHKYNTFKHFDV